MDKPVRPRLGLIVDGDAEFRSLKPLLQGVQSDFQLVEVIRGQLQPLAPPGVNARAICRSLGVLGALNVSRAIVLLDRETLAACPFEIRDGILHALTHYPLPAPVSSVEVVIKDRCFENWLIADVGCVSKMRKRFKLSGDVEQKIRAGRADAVDAQRLLKRAAIGKSYAKISDAVSICSKADPLAVALGSRSFRRLLRLMRHKDYLTQSKKPAA